MKRSKKVALAAANLLTLAANAAEASYPIRRVDAEASPAQSMTEAQRRMAEAAHLKVPTGCKWGHAAFDPVQVGAEPLSPEALALHRLTDIG